MSQEVLAAKAGVSRATIANLESGYTDNPEHSTVKALAQALGVRTRDLYFEEFGTLPLDPLIDAFRQTPLWDQLAPTDEEIAWLRRREIDWGGRSPTAETLYFMVLGRRAAKP